MVTTEKVSPLDGVLQWLQLPDDRAEISLDKIVMGAGGVLIPLGLARLFASSPLGFSTPVGIPGALPLFLAAALSFGLAAAAFFVPQVSGLRPAGYAMVLAAVALLAESISRLGDEPKGILGVFLFALFCGGLFVLPQTRHAVFLGAVLYAGWRFFVLLTSDFEFPNTFATAMNPSFMAEFSNLSAGLSVLLAGGCLAAVWFLDRSGSFGLSLPFASVGIVIAAFSVAPDINFIVSWLAFILAGAAVWVGVSLGRRGVAWAGAAGIVLSTGRLYDGFDSRLAGFVLLLVGAALLAFAARNELPAVAKAIGSLTSNSAVLPTASQPGPGQRQQPDPAYAPQQGVDLQGSAPGHGDFQGGDFQGGDFPQQGAFPQAQNLQPAGDFSQGELQPGEYQGAEYQGAEYQAAEYQPVDHFPDSDSGSLEPPNGQDLFVPAFDRQGVVNDPATTEFQLSGYQEQQFSEATTEDALPSHVQGEDPGPTAPFQTQSPDMDNADPAGAQLAEPNWYADPTERYDHRWHDGVNWTEHVATAGNSAVDPISS